MGTAWSKTATAPTNTVPAVLSSVQSYSRDPLMICFILEMLCLCCSHINET